MPSWATKRSTSLKIVVHRDRQGNYRFPAHVDAPVPQGFERLEVDSVAKARKVEREIRRQEEAKAADFAHRRLLRQEASLSQNESDLKAALRGEVFEVPNKKGEMVKQKGLSPLGKELVGKGLELIRKKREEGVSSKLITQAGNIGFEVLSYDSSNREAHRSEQTNWKAVKD
jgi:hypothetical protein